MHPFNQNTFTNPTNPSSSSQNSFQFPTQIPAPGAAIPQQRNAGNVPPFGHQGFMPFVGQMGAQQMQGYDAGMGLMPGMAQQMRGMQQQGNLGQGAPQQQQQGGHAMGQNVPQQQQQNTGSGMAAFGAMQASAGSVPNTTTQQNRSSNRSNAPQQQSMPQSQPTQGASAHSTTTSANSAPQLINGIANALSNLSRMTAMLLPQNRLPRVQQLFTDYFQERITGVQLHEELHSLITSELQTTPQNVLTRIQNSDFSNRELASFFSSASKQKYGELSNDPEALQRTAKENKHMQYLVELMKLESMDKRLKEQRHLEEQQRAFLAQQQQQQQATVVDDDASEDSSRRSPSAKKKKTKTPKSPTSAAPKRKGRPPKNKDDGKKTSASTGNETPTTTPASRNPPPKRQDDVELANYLHLWRLAGIDLQHEAQILAENRIEYFRELQAPDLSTPPPQLHHSYHFDVESIRERMSRVAQRAGCKNRVSDEVASFMSLALEYRIRNVLDGVVNAASRRLEVHSYGGTGENAVSALVQENNRKREEMRLGGKMDEDAMEIDDEDNGQQQVALRGESVGHHVKKPRITTQDCLFVIEQDWELRPHLSHYRSKYLRR